MSKNVLTKHVV
jgi:hypothetical protein